MQQPDQSHWHLLGAGAIGTLFASQLQGNGIAVTLVLRDSADGAPLRAAGGLTLSHNDSTQHFMPSFSGVDSAAVIDHLLVTTKAYQSLDALVSVLPRLTRDAVVVLLHNGFGPQQQAAARWPGLRLYAGTTTEGAYRESATRVVHAGRGETWLGPINAAANAAGSTALAGLLQLPIGCHYDPAITTRLWQKLALNAAINGLTVIHDCRNGELARQPDYRRQLQALCEETEALAAASGQPLFERPLFAVALAVAEATASNYSSMLQDVRHRRPTELDSINGTLCRLAAEIGLDLPTHRWLIAAVEQRAR